MKRALRWLGRHWLLWMIPLVGWIVWGTYVWRLARLDGMAPDMPFIYNL